MCVCLCDIRRDRRFLVIDPIQFILVEPEVKRIGWGIVKFSDLIQVIEKNLFEKKRKQIFLIPKF